MLKFPLLAIAISIQPLVSEDVIEPSVQNEIDHAISIAPAEVVADGAVTNVPAAVLSSDVFGTNGLNATQIAIRIVSAQGPDGRWSSGTNDVSAVAVDILRSVSW